MRVAVAPRRNPRPNQQHRGDPALDTSEFSGPGNLRIDYVLPSRTLAAVDCGVFWPAPDEEGADLIAASDHRLVWVDVGWPGE